MSNYYFKHSFLSKLLSCRAADINQAMSVVSSGQIFACMTFQSCILLFNTMQ